MEQLAQRVMVGIAQRLVGTSMSFEEMRKAQLMPDREHAQKFMFGEVFDMNRQNIITVDDAKESVPDKTYGMFKEAFTVRAARSDDELDISPEEMRCALRARREYGRLLAEQRDREMDEEVAMEIMQMAMDEFELGEMPNEPDELPLHMRPTYIADDLPEADLIYSGIGDELPPEPQPPAPPEPQPPAAEYHWWNAWHKVDSFGERTAVMAFELVTILHQWALAMELIPWYNMTRTTTPCWYGVSVNGKKIALTNLPSGVLKGGQPMMLGSSMRMTEFEYAAVVGLWIVRTELKKLAEECSNDDEAAQYNDALQNSEFAHSVRFNTGLDWLYFVALLVHALNISCAGVEFRYTDRRLMMEYLLFVDHISVAGGNDPRLRHWLGDWFAYGQTTQLRVYVLRWDLVYDQGADRTLQLPQDVWSEIEQRGARGDLANGGMNSPALRVRHLLYMRIADEFARVAGVTAATIGRSNGGKMAYDRVADLLATLIMWFYIGNSRASRSVDNSEANLWEIGRDGKFQRLDDAIRAKKLTPRVIRWIDNIAMPSRVSQVNADATMGVNLTNIGTAELVEAQTPHYASSLAHPIWTRVAGKWQREVPNSSKETGIETVTLEGRLDREQRHDAANNASKLQRDLEEEQFEREYQDVMRIVREFRRRRARDAAS